MPAKVVPGVSGQGHGSHEVCVGAPPCTCPPPPLDFSQHTPVSSLAAVTWSTRWWSASPLSPLCSLSSTTTPPQGVATRQVVAREGLRGGRPAPWRCASGEWPGLTRTVWRGRERRGEKLWGGARGKGASDNELVEGSLRRPTPPRHRPRQLPCARLISNWIKPVSSLLEIELSGGAA